MEEPLYVVHRLESSGASNSSFAVLLPHHDAEERCVETPPATRGAYGMSDFTQDYSFAHDTHRSCRI